MRVYRTEFQVRGYELDGYGHVNHAVYMNYAEYARWCMIEEATGGSEFFARNGVFPVIVRAEVDYKEPCYLAEWLVVETTQVEYRTRVVRLRQTVKKRDSGRVAADIIVTLLCVDKSGKAVSLPAEMAKFFDEPEGAGE